jgi:hypothetical protein
MLLKQSPTIPSSIQGAVQSFQKFIEKTPIEVDPEFVESRLVNHAERYAGTIDALACISGIWGVLDIKTSQAIYRDLF